MANDGSLASRVEEWIRDAIRALAPFADRNVDVFAGTSSPTGEQLVAELGSGKQSPYAVVLFEDDVPRALEEGEQAYDPTYAIYVIVKSKRPAAARVGDFVQGSTVYGTNGYRDLIRNALHDKSPAFGANGFWAERAEFRGVRLVFQRKDVFVLRAEVVVREVPTAV